VKPLLVLLLAALACAGCKRKGSVVSSPPLPAVQVQVATVQWDTAPALIETSGTVRAVRRATLAAKIAGTIVSPALILGHTVRAGDVLFSISAPELSARVVQVNTQLAQVERELTRERQLHAAGAGARDAVKSLEDRLAQTKAAVHEAETMVAYTTVRAPFDGFIAHKHVEPGDYATAGTPLLQLDGRDAFELDVGLPDTLASSLAVGAKLDVEIPATSVRFRAAISELSSSSESAARTTTAKVAIPSDIAVRPGLFARVFIPGPPASALLAPANAVSLFGQMERVFAVTIDNRASLRFVKTGGRRGNAIEIVAGLDAGERVVLSPSPSLRDNQPLEFGP
jgi:membrane fusion protein, multidrug efflux system